MNSLRPLFLLIFTCVLTTIANGQLNKLTTFDEMWIVSAKFDGVDGESITQKSGFGPLKNYTAFSKPGKHQATDLLKIIADTPFLSLEIISNSKTNEAEQFGDSRISLEPHPWDSLNKLGKEPWSIMVKSGNSHFIFIPLAVPDVLEKQLKKNGGLLTSSIPGLENVNIKSIRIENGTYLKG